jgi:hypothetical protein
MQQFFISKISVNGVNKKHVLERIDLSQMSKYYRILQRFLPLDLLQIIKMQTLLSLLLM